MESYGEIDLTEHLGRGISSSRSANKARKDGGRVPFHEFMPPQGPICISVDRTDIAPLDEAISIAEKRDVIRSRIFYGWAVVSAKDAAREGRKITASSIPGNPYHADIILPQDSADDRDKQRVHAHQLADASHWNERQAMQIYGDSRVDDS